ncbi:MAG: hypothetical protein IPP13_08045 [Kouleothrix sp.]|nr:hypothetical protein [Kouleothrix sp.]
MASQSAVATARLQPPDEAAIIDTLTGYNRVGSEAAALLTLEPLRPFIEPNGDLHSEGGAVAPEQASVRVSYTLRWDEAAGRWLIVESELMNL